MQHAAAFSVPRVERSRFANAHAANAWRSRPLISPTWRSVWRILPVYATLSQFSPASAYIAARLSGGGKDLPGGMVYHTTNTIRMPGFRLLSISHINNTAYVSQRQPAQRGGGIFCLSASVVGDGRHRLPPACDSAAYVPAVTAVGALVFFRFFAARQADEQAVAPHGGCRATGGMPCAVWFRGSMLLLPPGGNNSYLNITSAVSILLACLRLRSGAAAPKTGDRLLALFAHFISRSAFTAARVYPSASPALRRPSLSRCLRVR